MRYVFITGMGRSGTTFVSTVLSEAREAWVGHERIGNRRFWLLSWYLAHTEFAVDELRREGARLENEAAQRSPEPSVFVEVNGYLHHSVPALREVFDGCRVFHLVRDPRRVVPSIYLRRSRNSVPVMPRERSELKSFQDGDTFYQVCWNWASATRTLIDQRTPLIRLEDIVSSYDEFRRQLLEPAGLEVSEDEWLAMRERKVNRTRSALYRFLYAKLKGKEHVATPLPEYAEWTDRQLGVFRELCGDLLTELGYHDESGAAE